MNVQYLKEPPGYVLDTHCLHCEPADPLAPFRSGNTSQNQKFHFSSWRQGSKERIPWHSSVSCCSLLVELLGNPCFSGMEFPKMSLVLTPAPSLLQLLAALPFSTPSTPRKESSPGQEPIMDEATMRLPWMALG